MKQILCRCLANSQKAIQSLSSYFDTFTLGTDSLWFVEGPGVDAFTVAFTDGFANSKHSSDMSEPSTDSSLLQYWLPL